MDKKEALGIIFRCAREYQQLLQNQNIMFVFGCTGKVNFFEASFPEQNFMHLTGVSVQGLTATQFYKACLDKRLSESQFSFAPNGTTPMKLEILPKVMNIHKTVKMVGEYNHTQTYLYTEKIAGNVFASLGFVKDRNYPETNYYVPNTALRSDIRDITVFPQQRVLAVSKKSTHDDLYHHLCYLAKGIYIDTLALPTEISLKIDRAQLTIEANIKPTPNKYPETTLPSTPTEHTPKLSIYDRIAAAKETVARREAEKRDGPQLPPPQQSGPKR